MKKGINIWSFPQATLAENFKLAKDAGFEGVELGLLAEGEVSLKSTEKDLLAVKKCAADNGIELYSVATGLYWDNWLTSDCPKERQATKDIVKKHLEVAKTLGCDTILVVPGSVSAEFAAPGKVVDYVDAYERSLEALTELKSEAERLQVNIGIENVWNQFLCSPVEMRDFIDKIDSPYVGSYFDVGNVLFNGRPEHWIKALGSRIKKVHFKDYRVAAGGLHGFVDLLAGDVNYPAVTKALADIGYDGWVSAEMIPNYTHYTETIIYNTSNAMDRILGRKKTMLKVGLIGCGFMGSMHANCYNNIADAKVVAVADVRREKAEELAKISGAEIYATGMELIAKADVDVIDICLPTYLHAEHALAAMDKVKYVFLEKPVTMTMAEANALLDKAAKTGAQVQVGQVIRFWDEYVELAKVLKAGTYGKVINANFRRLSPLPTWGWEQWSYDVSKSGGAGQDLHVHDIDYVLSQFGEPKKFISAKSTQGFENDYVHTVMIYDDFVVSVEGTWALPQSYPFTATFRVVMEKATLECAGGKLMCYQDSGAHQIEIEKVQLAGEGYKGGNVSDLGGYYNELVYFCDKAAKGEKIQEATLEAATASLDFLLRELAYKA